MSSYDNTHGIATDFSSKNENGSVDTELNIKTGTNMSADAGIEENTLSVDLSYTDTTEAHATIDAHAMQNGIGTSAEIDAYIISGTQAETHVSVGDHGIDVNGGMSCGAAVGVDASGTIDLGEVSATTTAGISVGEQFSIGGGAETTIDNGVVTIGVEGDVASYVGVDCDLSVSVDTKQIASDIHNVGKQVGKTSSKINKKSVSKGAKKLKKKL